MIWEGKKIPLKWRTRRMRRMNVVSFRVISAKSFSSSWDFTLHLIQKRLEQSKTSIMRWTSGDEKNKNRKKSCVAIIISPISSWSESNSISNESKEKKSKKTPVCVFSFLIEFALHLSQYSLSSYIAHYCIDRSNNLRCRLSFSCLSFPGNPRCRIAIIEISIESCTELSSIQFIVRL